MKELEIGVIIGAIVGSFSETRKGRKMRLFCFDCAHFPDFPGDDESPVFCKVKGEIIDACDDICGAFFANRSM